MRLTLLITSLASVTLLAAATVASSSLWPLSSDLINVGLAAKASGNCSPALQVLVYANEDD